MEGPEISHIFPAPIEIASVAVNIPHLSGTFVILDKPTLIT